MLTINFFEDGNRYRAENFKVYINFNGLPNDISFIYVVESFVISTCLSYVVIVCVFLRNHIFAKDTLRSYQRLRLTTVCESKESVLKALLLGCMIALTSTLQ